MGVRPNNRQGDPRVPSDHLQGRVGRVETAHAAALQGGKGGSRRALLGCRAWLGGHRCGRHHPPLRARLVRQLQGEV
ncbi:hypothetical protein NFJ02_37g93200 [Pycnococcus provasolii]